MEQPKRSGLPPQVSAFLVVLALLGVVIVFAMVTGGGQSQNEEGAVEAADEEVVDPFADLPDDPADPENAQPEKKEEKAFDPFAGVSDLAMDDGWKGAIDLAVDGRTSAKAAEVARLEGRTDDAVTFTERAKDAYERALRQGAEALDRFTGEEAERIQKKLDAWEGQLAALRGDG